MSISILGLLIGIVLAIGSDSMIGQIGGMVIVFIAMIGLFVHDWQQKGKVEALEKRIDKLEGAVFPTCEEEPLADSNKQEEDSK